ncbi:MAG: GNAT family protein [Alphaproteobacteria bacterium]|nr:GNAT family protein [Alphaproteobacteria bacterium]
MWHRLASLFHFSRRGMAAPMNTRLTGRRVFLRMGDPADWAEWRSLRETSREFLVPWEPSWPPNALTYNFFCGLLRRQWRDWRKGHGYAFFIFLQAPEGQAPKLIGGITLSDIRKGIAQKGTLGYWIGQTYAGQGYMTEAAGLLCEFAFKNLRMHRLEASCLPHNEASINLLRRLGFEEEGYAKAYLQINGRWEDHILWGKMNPNSVLNRILPT